MLAFALIRIYAALLPDVAQRLQTTVQVFFLAHGFARWMLELGRDDLPELGGCPCQRFVPDHISRTLHPGQFSPLAILLLSSAFLLPSFSLRIFLLIFRAQSPPWSS